MELSSLTASVTLGDFVSSDSACGIAEGTYINELGFFFFLRIAVAVSSICGGLSAGPSFEASEGVFTSWCSAPDGSLVNVNGCYNAMKPVAGAGRTWRDPPSCGCGLAQPT